MIIVTLFSGNIATNGLSFYWDWFDVWHPQFDKALHMILRFVIGTFGSLFIMGAVKQCIRVVPSLTALAFLGTETLGIYLLQGLLIRGISNPFVALDATVWQLLLSSVVVFGTAFIVVEALKRNRWMRCAVFGVGLPSHPHSAETLKNQA